MEGKAPTETQRIATAKALASICKRADRLHAEWRRLHGITSTPGGGLASDDWRDEWSDEVPEQLEAAFEVAQALEGIAALADLGWQYTEDVRTR